MSDTLNLANSIWPNGMKVDSDGYAIFYPLGTNKVNVPTSSSEWPKGNKLVSPFVYQDDKLVGFVDTKALAVSDNTTIYLPYTHIEAEFSAIDKGQLQIHAPNATTKKVSWKDSGVEDIAEVQFKYKGCKTVDDVKAVDPDYKTNDIVDGTWSEPLWDLVEGGNGFDDVGMFYHTELASFSSDLPSLMNGYQMFCDTKLTSFNSDLPSLTNGYGMFSFCDKLTSFNSDLPSLMNGEFMFSCCNNLETFSSDLSSLTNGDGMFTSCTKLTSFNGDLSNLTYGGYMFYGTNLASFNVDLSSLMNGGFMFDCCDNLETFSSDLSSLTNGRYMFKATKLTSFTSDLSSLEDGDLMFFNCYKLTSFTSDLSSLTDAYQMFDCCMLDTASVQHIADTINTPSSKKTIHIGIGNSTPNSQEEAAFNKIVSKNWIVYVSVNNVGQSQWNPTSLIPIDGEEQQTPIPFWAKPVQSDEEHARYVDAQGNFFNILGGNFIYGDTLDTYGMFTCEEDAAAQMLLTPYVKPQTKIENQ